MEGKKLNKVGWGPHLFLRAVGLRGCLGMRPTDMGRNRCVNSREGGAGKELRDGGGPLEVDRWGMLIRSEVC